MGKDCGTKCCKTKIKKADIELCGSYVKIGDRVFEEVLADSVNVELEFDDETWKYLEKLTKEGHYVSHQECLRALLREHLNTLPKSVKRVAKTKRSKKA